MVGGGERWRRVVIGLTLVQRTPPGLQGALLHLTDSADLFRRWVWHLPVVSNGWRLWQLRAVVTVVGGGVGGTRLRQLLSVVGSCRRRWAVAGGGCQHSCHRLLFLQDRYKKAFFTVPLADIPAPGQVAGADPLVNVQNIRRTLWAWAVRHGRPRLLVAGGGLWWPAVAGGGRFVRGGLWHSCTHPPSRQPALQFNGEELPTAEEMAGKGPVTDEELYEVARKMWGLGQE